MCRCSFRRGNRGARGTIASLVKGKPGKPPSVTPCQPDHSTRGVDIMEGTATGVSAGPSEPDASSAMLRSHGGFCSNHSSFPLRPAASCTGRGIGNSLIAHRVSFPAYVPLARDPSHKGLLKSAPHQHQLPQPPHRWTDRLATGQVISRGYHHWTTRFGTQADMHSPMHCWRDSMGVILLLFVNVSRTIPCMSMPSAPLRSYGIRTPLPRPSGHHATLETAVRRGDIRAERARRHPLRFARALRPTVVIRTSDRPLTPGSRWALDSWAAGVGCGMRTVVATERME
jgi:hypothetical protein